MEANKFAQALSRAQELILDDNFNMMVESKSASMNGRTPVYNQQRNAAPQPQNYERIQYVNENSSKLPDIIKESFKKVPPMSGDMVDNSPLAQITNSIPTHVVTEAQRYQQPMQPQNTGGIDYSLIKAIIDESVKRNIEEIRSSLLNESTTAPMFRGMKICEGNKFQFLDNKGNLYEATLKLKKKASK